MAQELAVLGAVPVVLLLMGCTRHPQGLEQGQGVVEGEVPLAY